MTESSGFLTKFRKLFRKNNMAGYVTSQQPDMLTSRIGLFSKNVSVNELREMFKRDEFLNAGIKRLASDIFDNWAEIVALKKNGTLNEDVTDSIRRLIISLNLKHTMRQAFISRMVHGVAVIGIGFPGIISEPAEPSRTPSYVSNIPWTIIKEFYVDMNPESSNYSNVIGMMIERQVGTSDGKVLNTEQTVVHSTRFVHWPMPDIDGVNPMGMPGLLPLYDALTVKKNIDWSLGETLYQYATKHYIFQFPPTTPDVVYNKGKNDLKDFNAVTSFVYRGEPLQISDFGGDGQLNPDPYTRYVSSLISLGIGVPYPILFKGLTGGVSDIVQRDYASDVAAIQRNEVEPAVRDFLRKCGYDDTLIVFKWLPIIEMTEQEKSYITSRKSLGRNLTSKAIGFFRDAGLAIEFDEDGWIKRVFVPDNKENVLLPPTKEELLAKAQAMAAAKGKVIEQPESEPEKKKEKEEEDDEEKMAKNVLLDEMRAEEKERQEREKLTIG